MQQIHISKAGQIEAHGLVVGRVERTADGWVWVDDAGQVHRPQDAPGWSSSREARVDALRANGLHR